MFAAIDITDPGFSDQLWQEYYRLLTDLRDRHGSILQARDWEALKAGQLSFVHSRTGLHRFLITERERLVGWGDFRIMGLDTAHRCASFRFDALYEEIPESFSHLLAGEILRLLDRYDCSSVHLLTSDQRLSAAVRKWNGEELNCINRYRLYRDRANWVVIDRWLREIPSQNRDLRLILVTAVPDTYLESYALLYSRFLNEMPSNGKVAEPFTITPKEVRIQEKWARENSTHLYLYLLINRQDELVGLTHVWVNGQNPKDIYQAMTGVVADYRGRGLSKWLKSAMFKKIGEDYPQNRSFTTDMRAVNIAINRVNEEMGYVLFSQGNEYNLYADGLRKFLD